MGRNASGDIQITLQNEKDADYVYDQIEKIEELTLARTDFKTADFNLHDNCVENNTFYCNVYSSRAQNADFQVKQVLEQVKIMVKERKILPPYGFNGEILTQYSAWSMDDEEFNDLLSDEEE